MKEVNIYLDGQCISIGCDHIQLDKNENSYEIRCYKKDENGVNKIVFYAGSFSSIGYFVK